MSQLEFRSPKPDEMAAVRDLRLKELYEPMGYLGNLETDPDIDAAADTIHMVAVEDGKVVSTLRIENDPLFNSYINVMVTTASRRGRGIGSKLLEAAEAKARQLKIGRLTAHARKEAMPFYKDYKEKGAIGVTIVGPNEDQRMMVAYMRMEKEIGLKD